MVGSDEYYYEADISGADKYSSTVNVPAGMRFVGWYDNPEGIGEKYTFDGKTMPPNNLILYAKLVPEEYFVRLDYNGGETKGSESTFAWVDYGETIEEAEAVKRNYVEIGDGEVGTHNYIYWRYDEEADANGDGWWSYYEDADGNIVYNDPKDYSQRTATYVEAAGGKYKYDPGKYTFVGWYETDEAGNQISNVPFNFATQITKDTYLKAVFRKEGSFQVRYLPNMGTEGTEGYVAGDPNTAPPTDSYTYIDLSEAKVGHSIEPADSKYQFAGWRVKGTEGPIYQPGETFPINSDYAEEENGIQYITLEPVFIQNGDTSITYEVNTPAGATATGTNLTDLTDNTQNKLILDGAVTLHNGDGFSVTGFKLIGWSDKPLDPFTNIISLSTDETYQGDIPSDTHIFKLGGHYGVSDEEGNTLYAVWEPLMTPVSFIKEGEQGDGTFELLAGAEFTLYADAACTQGINSVYKSIQNTETIATSSGTADPDDGTNVTFPKVPVGTFYFKETAVDAAYGLDNTTVHTIVVTENDDEDRTLTYTVDGEAIHTIRNYLKGTLAVSKTVVSELASDASKEFSFTVTLSDTTVNGTKGEMEFADGVAVFTLKDGEDKKAKGLPNGITYTVEETTVDGFETTSTGATGTYDASASQLAQFTNTRKMVDVTVAKEVTDSSDTTVFPFTVTLKDGEIPVKGLTIYRDPDDESKNLTTDESTGQVTFNLSHGTQKILTVPVGITMVITEDAGSYTAEVPSGSIEGTLDGKTYTLTVPSEGGTVTYKNTISDAKLRIHKIGDDAENGLAGAEFSLVRTETSADFTDYTSLISMDASQGTSNLGYLPSGDSEDSMLFTLPDGLYTLTEKEAPQYYEGLSGNVTISVNTGVITATAATDDESAVSLSEPDANGVYTLTVTNTRKKATVTVIKNVTGTEEDKDSQYTFTATGLTEEADQFQLYGQRKTEMVEEVETVTQENTKTYEDIPHGTIFSIAETENADFFTAITLTRADGTTIPVTGTKAENITVDGNITITYTNRRNKQPVSIWKTDFNHDALTGAKFVLYKADDYDDNANDGAGAPKTGAVPVVEETSVGSNGILALGSLNVGEYRLVETQAPSGYINAESAIKIYVRPDAVTAMQGTGNAEVARDNADNEYRHYWVTGQDKGTWQIRVWNNPGVSLPATGGPGTILLYLLGITLLGLAGAGFVMKRRQREAA